MNNILNAFRFGSIPAEPIPYPNIISHYKLDTNGTDEKFVNSLQYTGSNEFSHIGGKVGDSALATGVTEDVMMSKPSDSLSFSNGTNDLPFSISFWYRRTSSVTRILMSRRGSTDNDGDDSWEIGYSATDEKMYFILGSGDFLNAISKRWSDTAGTGFNHITITYNGSKTSEGINIYVNGSLSENQIDDPKGTYSGLIQNETRLTVFGRESESVFPWHGRLDELTFWDKELTPGEIISVKLEGDNGNSIYTGEKASIPSSNVLSYWKFDGDLLDSVGTNDGHEVQNPTLFTEAGKVDLAVSVDSGASSVNPAA